MSKALKLFSGNSNPALAKEISAYVGQELSAATVTTFSDGEIRVRIEENVRGQMSFSFNPVVPRSIHPSWNYSSCWMP